MCVLERKVALPASLLSHTRPCLNGKSRSLPSSLLSHTRPLPHNRYAGDFSEDGNEGLLRYILQYCDEEKGAELGALLDSGDYSVSYMAYNWSDH